MDNTPKPIDVRTIKMLENNGAQAELSNETLPRNKESRPYIRQYTLESSESSSRSAQQQTQQRRKHEIYLWIALTISSFLALLSGLDATLHCTVLYDFENNDDYVDDDYNMQYQQAQREAEWGSCLSMLKTVIVPSATAGVLLSLLAALFLFRPKILKRRFSPTEDSLVTTNTKQNDISKETNPQPLLSLALMSLFSLVVWTRGIIAIMLEDQSRSSEYQGFQLKFQSLGAVNNMGEVGDNANLYYSSWASLILSIVLVYYYSNLIFCKTSRRPPLRRSRSNLMLGLSGMRQRTSVWTALLIWCTVIFLSSSRIWKVIVSEETDDNDEYFRAIFSFDNAWSIFMTGSSENDDDSDEELYRRTEAAVLMGALGCFFSTLAAFSHIFVIYVQRHCVGPGTSSFPQALESFLALLLVVLFGSGVSCVTGYGGPAQAVGNLYYSTMGALVLSIRIGMACLEEVISVHDPVILNPCSSRDGLMHVGVSAFGQVEANSLELMTDDDRGILSPDQKNLHQSLTEKCVNERPGYLRRWGFLCVFSAISFISGIDAATEHNKQRSYEEQYVKVTQGISSAQRWTIASPCVVMTMAFIMFILCVSSRTYLLVYNLQVGGLVSFISMLFCVSVIITLEHSEDSFAMDELGQIISANVYYFSWGSVLTAGYNFSTYIKRITGNIETSTVYILWVSVLKVCFVVLGAATHIWLTVREDCAAESIIPFCYRTKFALGAGILGLCLAVLAVLSRSLNVRGYLVIEVICSTFLFVTFGFGSWFITGMGGPGDSVGDLYYATWLSFILSLASVISCWGEINKNEVTQDSQNEIEASQYVEFDDKN